MNKENGMITQDRNVLERFILQPKAFRLNFLFSVSLTDLLSAILFLVGGRRWRMIECIRKTFNLALGLCYYNFEEDLFFNDS